MGIHAAMLPTGQGDVVFVSPEPFARHGGSGTAPEHRAGVAVGSGDGRTKRVDPPLWRDPADGVAQAGQHLVRRADLHRRRAAGGVRRQPGFSATARCDYKGLDKVYTFNPFNETWTEQPDMRHGRWYPTGVRTADGRIAIISGLDETGANFTAQHRRRAVHALGRPQRARHGRRLLGTSRRRGPAAASAGSTRTCSPCRPGA